MYIQHLFWCEFLNANVGQGVILCNLGGPLRSKLVVEVPRVKGSQHVAAYPKVVLEDEGEGGTEGSVRTNEPAQRTEQKEVLRQHH